MPSIKESALRLVLKAKDTLSRPVQQSAASLETLRHEAKALKQKLADLEKQDRLLSSFQKQTAAVRDAGRAFREAEEKVERLAREYQQADNPTKTLQRRLESARKTVIAANQSYHSQRQKLAELRKSLEQVGLSNRQITRQQAQVSQAVRETSAAYKKASTRSKEASKHFRRSGLNKVAKDADRASGSLGRLSRRFAGVVAASVGLYTLKRAVQGLLSTGDKFERLSVQLEAITGSAANGERALAWVKDFTKNTPYQLHEVSEAFVRLKAFGLDPMDGSMQAVVDQAVMLGGGFDRLRGISVGLGQAWAKQRLQGEEILQLVERGVPVWEMLEKVTGKNVLEIRKLSEAGKLGRDVIRGLIQEIGKGADGAAAKNMTLLSGYVSNLKDSWTFFLDEISKSGALDCVKDQLKNLADQIKIMNDDGRLPALAKKISESFIALGEAVKTAVGDLTFDEAVAKANSSFSAITLGLNKVASAFVITSNSVTLFFNGFAVGVKGFASAFLYTTGEIIYGYGKLSEIANFDGIANGAIKTTNYLRSLGAEFAKSAAENVETVNKSLGKIVTEITKKSDDATKKLQEKYKKSINLNKKYIDDLLGNYKKTETVIKDVGETATKTFKDAAAAMEQIKAVETRTELASLGVTLAEALREGVLSQEEYYEATEASRQKLKEFNKEAGNTKDAVEEVGDSAEEAGDQQTEALEGASSIAAVMAGHYNAITAELQGMSSAAHDAFVAMQGGVNTSEAKGDIAELKNELKETNQELSDLRHSAYTVFDATGISAWFNETATDAAYVKTQFLEQKIALEELFESYEQGELNSRNFVKQGERAADTMNLLNEQDLDKLNSAIQSAESNMEQLGDSSRNTLDGLKNELDQLKGKQDEVERRNYENQKRELKAELEEAKEKGDSASIQNLNKSLSGSVSRFITRSAGKPNRKKQKSFSSPRLNNLSLLRFPPNSKPLKKLSVWNIRVVA